MRSKADIMLEFLKTLQTVVSSQLYRVDISDKVMDSEDYIVAAEMATKIMQMPITEAEMYNRIMSIQDT